MILQRLNILFRKYRQAKASQQLKWQESLQKKAVGFRTEVLEIVKEGEPLDGYVQCNIRTRLRVRGKIVCRTVRTLLAGETQVKKGDRILIRYRPQHLQQGCLVFIWC